MSKLPKFTNEEKYLIEFLKNQKASVASNTYMWTYLVFGMALAGFAIYQQEFTMMIVAFVLVVCFRIYEDSYQVKWQPKWKSIILKFEAAMEGGANND